MIGFAYTANFVYYAIDTSQFIKGALKAAFIILF